jgi:hypothetical protein
MNPTLAHNQPQPIDVPQPLRKLRYLIAYAAHNDAKRNRMERRFAKIRENGYDVEGFCVAVPSHNPQWSFEQLDKAWRNKLPHLMDMYDRLESRLRSKDVFILMAGPMIHPDFFPRISTYNVYFSSEESEATETSTRVTASCFDYCFTRHPALVDFFRSWGCAKVTSLCAPVDPEFCLPEFAVGSMSARKKDLDTLLFGEMGFGGGEHSLVAERLIREFPRTYVHGRGWPDGFTTSQELRGTCERARVGWWLGNTTGLAGRRETTLPAFGILQLCDNRTKAGMIFNMGEEAVGFDTPEECIDKTRYYLAHAAEREEIAWRGWMRAVTDYNEVRDWQRTLAAIGETAIRKLRLDKQPARFTLPTGPVKLHIGCGMEHWKGYVNIDRDASASPDIQADARDIHKFVTAGTVQEAVMIHCLNYMTLWEAREFFRNMFKLMAPGGVLVIETPDVERLLEKIRGNARRDLGEHVEGVRGFHAFGLDNLNEQRPYTPNSFSWTSWHLEDELRQAGFEARTVAAQTHCAWRDMRIEARKSPHAAADWSGAHRANASQAIK